ncbi:MAG: HNH endonuclease [Gammaproteobacteria bacterium]
MSLGGKSPYRKIELAPHRTKKFWGSVVVRKPYQCWEWSGPKHPIGYGRFAGHQAHRIAWFLTFGDCPVDQEIMHLCDNRSCCNPNHLLAGTHEQNMGFAAAQRRMPYGENHYSTKLTEDDVKNIRKKVRQGQSQEGVARLYGITQSSVSHIVSGKAWKYVS